MSKLHLFVTGYIMLTLTKLIIDKNLLAGLLAQFDIGAYYNVMRYVVVEHMSNYLAVRIALDMQRATTSNAGMSRMHFASKLSCNIYVVMHVVYVFISIIKCIAWQDVTYCYRQRDWHVCVPFGGVDLGGPKEPCIRWGQTPPMHPDEGAILGVSPRKCLLSLQILLYYLQIFLFRRTQSKLKQLQEKSQLIKA